MQMCQVCLGAMSEKQVKEEGVLAGRGGVRHKVCPAPPPQKPAVEPIADRLDARRKVYAGLSRANKKTRDLMEQLQRSNLADLDLATIFDEIYSDLSEARNAAGL